MAILDEGYIKFDLHWERRVLPPGTVPAGLVEMRNRLWGLGLVGVYAESGIGFGNVSVRAGGGGRFIVSGSGTGAIVEAGEGHFCLVTETDANRNFVRCEGPVPASSESLTHAALYGCGAEVGAVLHVHHAGLWEWLLGKVPTTPGSTAYGTPAMAREVLSLYRETDLPGVRLLAMAGHPEGLASFGRTLGEAWEPLERALGEWRVNSKF